MPLADMTHSVRRVATVFGEAEFKEIAEWCRKHKLSVYALAKKAIREYVRKNP